MDLQEWGDLSTLAIAGPAERLKKIFIYGIFYINYKYATNPNGPPTLG